MEKSSFDDKSLIQGTKQGFGSDCYPRVSGDVSWYTQYQHAVTAIELQGIYSWTARLAPILDGVSAVEHLLLPVGQVGTSPDGSRTIHTLVEDSHALPWAEATVEGKKESEGANWSFATSVIPEVLRSIYRHMPDPSEIWGGGGWFGQRETR